MLLELPDIRQHDDFSCGAVSMEIALRHDGISPGRWIRKLASPITGVNVDTLTSAMHAAYDGRILSGAMDVPLLRHLTRQGRPVVCLVTDPGSGGGHWLTVRGVMRGRTYVVCPTNGRESYRVADFERRWVLTDAIGNWTLSRFGVCGFVG